MKTLSFCVLLSTCFLILVDLTLEAQPRNPFNLIDNKYDNILVAISPDVPEESGLIDQLRYFMTELSSTLFNATKRRTYIGAVTILIPKTWSENASYSVAATETFDKANIIVDKSNPQYGDGPYVKQVKSCGLPGEFIHLTPTFLRTEYTLYGPVGKTLTHEFGHLRWGLFDEYPLETGTGSQHFFFNTLQQVNPVKCAQNLRGLMRNRFTGRPCKDNSDTKLPEDDCRFFPEYTGSAGQGSLMYFNFLNQITEFCDNDPSDPNTLHSREAPSKHNILCNGRSAWEIMREHKDFANNANPPISNSQVIDTTPAFSLVRSTDTRIVAVIDTSGSMSTNDRLLKAKQAASTYISSILPDGVGVGLVTFNSTGYIVNNLTELTSTAVRDSLVSSLPIDDGGGTSIGGGIYSAIQVLKYTGADPKGGIIFVLTDGQQNSGLDICGVKPDVIAAEVVVDAVLFTENADEDLLDLVDLTGGRKYFSTDSDNTTALKDAFITAGVEQSAGENSDNIAYQIFSDSIGVGPKSHYEAEFSIDSNLEKDTSITMSWSDMGNSGISIMATDPDGTGYYPNGEDYDNKSSRVKLSISGTAKSGKWKYKITNQKSYTRYIQVSLSSRASTPAAVPITMKADIGTFAVNFSDPNSDYAVLIFAEVKQGHSAVIKAKVMSYIETPNGLVTKELKDNGAGADIGADDGVYSGYFTGFEGDGKYSVKVNVESVNGTSVKSVTAAGGQKALPFQYKDGVLDSINDTVKVSFNETESFSRSGSGGFFSVANQPLAGLPDIIPPSKIIDVKVTQINDSSGAITLQWTAVGDDLDNGKAARYEIRVSDNFTSLQQNFTSGWSVNDSILLHNQTLSSPKTSGEIETFILELPINGNSSYVFAVKAIDNDGLESDISNLVSASFSAVYVPYEGYTEPATTTEMQTTTHVITTVPTTEDTTTIPTTEDTTTIPTTEETTTISMTEDTTTIPMTEGTTITEQSTAITTTSEDTATSKVETTQEPTPLLTRGCAGCLLPTTPSTETSTNIDITTHEILPTTPTTETSTNIDISTHEETTTILDTTTNTNNVQPTTTTTDATSKESPIKSDKQHLRKSDESYILSTASVAVISSAATLVVMSIILAMVILHFKMKGNAAAKVHAEDKYMAHEDIERPLEEHGPEGSVNTFESIEENTPDLEVKHLMGFGTMCIGQPPAHHGFQQNLKVKDISTPLYFKKDNSYIITLPDVKKSC